MADKDTISELVKEQIEGSDMFVVEINVSPSNDIRILVDNQKGVTISECIELSRALEKGLDRDEQDFHLEVSSPGLSEPLKVLQQYKKNIGRNVGVVTLEGDKHEGKLTELTEKGFILEEQVKFKSEKKKRPEIKAVFNEYEFDRVRSVKVMVAFK